MKEYNCFKCKGNDKECESYSKAGFLFDICVYRKVADADLRRAEKGMVGLVTLRDMYEDYIKSIKIKTEIVTKISLLEKIAKQGDGTVGEDNL